MSNAARRRVVRLETILVAGGLAAAAILVSAPETFAAPRVRAWVALFAFIYPLGELVRRGLAPRYALDPLRRALVAVSLGQATLALCAAVAWLTSNSLDAIGGWAVLSLALALIAALVRRGAGVEPAAEWGGPIVFVLCLALVLPLLWFNDPLSPISDSLDHVGTLRKRVETASVFPPSAFYAESRENGPDARKGLWHAELAWIAKTTDTPVLTLWNALPLACSYWLLLALYAAARAMFPGRASAVVVVLLFVLSFEGGPAGSWLQRVGHPGRTALAAYWSIWALFLDRSQRAPAGLLALLGFGLAAFHVFGPVEVAVAATLLRLFSLLVGRRDVRSSAREIAAGAGWVVAGAAPYLAYRFFVSTPIVDTIHTEPQGLFYWTDSLFTLNPQWLLRSWGVVGLSSVAVALYFFGRARRELSLAFLVSGVLGTVGVIANPLVMPLLHGSLGYLTTRLAWFAPHLFLLSQVLVAAWARVRGRLVPRPALPLALSVVVLLLCGGYLVAAAQSCVERRGSASAAATGFRDAIDPLRQIDAAIGEPAVIASDAATGYAIPALTRHFTISASAQHTPPNDPDARERLRDTRWILSPYVNARDTVELLRKYDAGWVLLNLGPEPRKLRYLSYAGRDSYRESREKFDSRADLFEPVLDVATFRLYRLTPPARQGPLPAAGPALKPLPLTDPPPRDLGLGDDETSETFQFLGGGVLDASVEAGQGVMIRTRWVRTAEVDEANRYLVARFERQQSAGALSDTPFAKLARYADDRFRDRLTRARSSYAPGRGFLPPNDWPLGRPIEDTSRVRVPGRLAAGRYQLWVEVVEVPFFPNLYPSDFLFDPKRSEGYLVGEVSVTAPISASHENET